MYISLALGLIAIAKNDNAWWHIAFIFIVQFFVLPDL